MEILIVGGGYVGMYTARRLERLRRRGEATVTVVDPRGYMPYQPFLAEAAAGSVEPRHVIAPHAAPQGQHGDRGTGREPDRDRQEGHDHATA
jgi:NADH dehydrogenase FAD-containing subunit